MEEAAATPNESNPLTPSTSTHIPPHTTHTPHYRHYTPPHAAPSPRTRTTNIAKMLELEQELERVMLEEERENEVARKRGKVRGERASDSRWNTRIQRLLLLALLCLMP